MHKETLLDVFKHDIDTLVAPKTLTHYVTPSLYVSSLYFLKFNVSYASMIGFLVICLVALFVRNKRFVKFGVREATEAYGLFLLTQLAVVYSLADRGQVEKCLFTMILWNICSPLIHWASHTETYKQGFDSVGMQSFHDQIHHSSSHSRKPKNVAMEGLVNVIGMSWMCVPMWRFLHPWTCLYLSLVYATVHLINQRIFESAAHAQHHADKFTNYGPDYMDVLYNTKGDAAPEPLTNGVPNLILLGIFVQGMKHAFRGTERANK